MDNTEEVMMIMSTDWHLKKDNLAEVINLVEEQLLLAVRLKQNKIFCLGDVFDSRVSQRMEVLDAFDTILDIASLFGIVIYMIPGNHDKTDYDSTRSFLHYYRHNPSLNLIETNDSISVNDTTIVHMLPFFNKDSKNWKKNLKGIIKTVNNFPKHEHILLSHCSVVGSVNNDGGKVTDGVKVSSLKIFKYVFLGHYHNKQQPAKNVFHIPSIRQNNFGEDNKKGFTVLYTDGLQELVKPNFTEYIKISINLDEVEHSEIMKYADDLKEEAVDNNFRFEIIGNEAEVQAFDISYLNELGIDVKKKRLDLVPQEEDLTITDEIFVWKLDDVLKRFELFCKDQAVDAKQGLELLEKIFKS